MLPHASVVGSAVVSSGLSAPHEAACGAPPDLFCRVTPQDAYYSEGLKLPLILPLFLNCKRLEVEVPQLRGRSTVTLTRSRRRALSTGTLVPVREPSRVERRNRRLREVLGLDDYGVLGFREHIFTHQHSVVGRYMALAEHAFGTLVQRFLNHPHHIRMHYGHPDMANAHLMKRTGGVSRGALRVNVNEDIFLGYEMLMQGVGIQFTEYLFYGKGRDVEFNAASVFLKKLAQGCIMQVGVCVRLVRLGVGLLRVA